MTTDIEMCVTDRRFIDNPKVCEVDWIEGFIDPRIPEPFPHLEEAHFWFEPLEIPASELVKAFEFHFDFPEETDCKIFDHSFDVCFPGIFEGASTYRWKTGFTIDGQDLIVNMAWGLDPLFDVDIYRDNPVDYDWLTPVPIPGTVWLFGSALLGVGLLSKRKKPLAA